MYFPSISCGRFSIPRWRNLLHPVDVSWGGGNAFIIRPMDVSKTFNEGAANAAQTHPSALPSFSDHAYDIAIIGLGPAGATLARLLDKRFNIIAIDKKTLEPDNPVADMPRQFRKPCGGLLSPDAQRSLAAFDITLPADLLVSPQIFSVRVIDLGNDATRYYQRCYVNMDRHRFDQWLIGLIPDSVDAKLGSIVTSISSVKEGFCIAYTDAAGCERNVSSRIVVGAEGAFSRVRRLIYPSEKPHAYTSIQQWFKDENPSPFYSCIFDPAATDCCSWTISKDGFFIFGGAYPQKGAREAFEAQKKRLKAKGLIFGEPLRTEACKVMRPASPSDIRCGREGAFLIGEAAGFISASSLEGISFAFDSARILAETINKHGCTKKANRRYDYATAGLKRKAISKIAKARIIGSPSLRGAIMRVGIGSIKMAIPDFQG